MGIKEKLEFSADVTRFTLFKEGLFFKCYNEDAMVFAKLVKPYKVSIKYINTIGANVLSLGFPVSEAEKGRLAFDIISEKLGTEKFDAGSNKVTFSLKEDLKHGFTQRRNKKTLITESTPKSKKLFIFISYTPCPATLENR